MLDIQKLNTKNIEAIAKNGLKAVKDKLPMIFSVSALGCLVLAMYETAVATHKSDEQIAEEEARRAAELPLYENTSLSNIEKASMCWKNYTKAALYGGACAFFILAAERENHERYIAMVSAYELAKTAGDVRQDVENDILGPEKSAEIEQEVEKRVSARNDADYDIGIQEVPGRGTKTLYLEPYTNTPFWATQEDIRGAFNYLNETKHNVGCASINDFLVYLDLRTVPLAADWGWNEDDPSIEFEHGDSELVNDDPSLPAAKIGYSIEPKQDYGNDRRQC